MKRAISYLRVSSDEQADKNTSLRSQKEDISRFAEREGIKIVTFFTEDFSGKTFNRPEWNKLITYCKKNKDHIDYVLVANWYRFGRNVTEAFANIKLLELLGIEVQSIELHIDFSIPESLLVLSTLLTIPEVENTRRTITVKRGMKKRLTEGTWIFSCPQGYKRDRNTGQIYITEEGECIRKGFQMLAKGKRVYQVIEEMKLMGMDCNNSKAYRIFKNPLYCGLMVSAMLNEAKMGNHEPLVSVEEWQDAQNTLNQNRLIKSKVVEDFFQLRGNLKCPVCNNNLTGYYVKKKQKKIGYKVRTTEIPYYKCSKKGCKVNISSREIHANFESILESISLKDQLVPAFKSMLQEMFEGLNEEYISNLHSYKSRKGHLTNQLNKLNDKYLYKNTVDEATYLSEKKRINDMISGITLKINELEINVSNPNEFINYCIALLSRMPVMWSDSNNDEKSELAKLIFPKGVYYNKENKHCRTLEINEIFAFTARISKKVTNESDPFTLSGQEATNVEPVITLKSFNYFKNFMKNNAELMDKFIGKINYEKFSPTE